MGCAVKPMSYVATITTNGDYEGGSGSNDVGVFNPISRLVATEKFTSVRFACELLSRSSSNVQLGIGGRETNDGKVWGSYFNLATLDVPSIPWFGDGALGWHYFPFLQPGSLRFRYFQFGLYARLASTSNVRGVAVVRVRLDFKNSLVPVESE